MQKIEILKEIRCEMSGKRIEFGVLAERHIFEEYLWSLLRQIKLHIDIYHLKKIS